MLVNKTIRPIRVGHAMYGRRDKLPRIVPLVTVYEHTTTGRTRHRGSYTAPFQFSFGKSLGKLLYNTPTHSVLSDRLLSGGQGDLEGEKLDAVQNTRRMGLPSLPANVDTYCLRRYPKIWHVYLLVVEKSKRKLRLPSRK